MRRILVHDRRSAVDSGPAWRPGARGPPGRGGRVFRLVVHQGDAGKRRVITLEPRVREAAVRPATGLVKRARYRAERSDGAVGGMTETGLGGLGAYTLAGRASGLWLMRISPA